MSENNHKTSEHFLFISWSGTLSKALARVFFSWLIDNFAQIKPFFSEEHIGGGEKWRVPIENALRSCKMLVAFVTRSNLDRSHWMAYEMGAIGSREEFNRVGIVLADMGRSEFGSRSENPFSERHCTTFADKEGVLNLLASIIDSCGLEQTINRPQLNKLFSGRTGWSKLKREWNKAMTEYEGEDLDMNPVKNSFPHDDAFEKWADNYHHIIHYSRHSCLRVLSEADTDTFLTKESVQKKLRDFFPRETPGEVPQPHPALIDVGIRLHFIRMLNYMEKVFEQIVKQPGTEIWVCLRDLRVDGKYYTLERSQGSPNDNAQNTVGWDSKCGAIQDLKETYERQKCAFIKNRIEYPDHAPSDWWAPVGPRRAERHRPASMMVGAVLTKWLPTGNENPLNADLWIVLCVSSNKPDVFRDAHMPILQGCNDSFSSVANSILSLWK